MSRTTATQIEILDSIVARLLTEIDEFSPGTCFLSLFPVPVPAPSGQIGAIIAPGGGSFDSDLEVLGGPVAADTSVTEAGSVTVLIFTRVQTDEVGHSDLLLNDAALGLLAMKKRVLKALLVDWEPAVGDRNLLRDMLSPVSCSDPDYDEPKRVGSISLTFNTTFDWDLT